MLRDNLFFGLFPCSFFLLNFHLQNTSLVYSLLTLTALYFSLKTTIVPLFEKILSASDASRIGRLVLPKACAEVSCTLYSSFFSLINIY